MAERSSWTGSAADLLRAGADRSSDDTSRGSVGWPKNPRGLAGRLRRAQTFLRALGIEVAFAREGRAGTRVIRMHTMFKDSVSCVGTVSSIRDNGSGSWSGPLEPKSADDLCDDNWSADLVDQCPIGRGPFTALDAADATDATADSGNRGWELDRHDHPM
jgi:hypothetical protein